MHTFELTLQKRFVPITAWGWEGGGDMWVTHGHGNWAIACVRHPCFQSSCVSIIFQAAPTIGYHILRSWHFSESPCWSTLSDGMEESEPWTIWKSCWIVSCTLIPSQVSKQKVSRGYCLDVCCASDVCPPLPQVILNIIHVLKRNGMILIRLNELWPSISMNDRRFTKVTYLGFIHVYASMNEKLGWTKLIPDYRLLFNIKSCLYVQSMLTECMNGQAG